MLGRNIFLISYVIFFTSQADSQFFHQRRRQSCRSTREVCLEVYQCEPIIAKLRQRLITPRDLRELTCGFNNQTPKVCCPSDDTAVQVENTGGRPIVSSKPRVTSTTEPSTTSSQKPEEPVVLLTGEEPSKNIDESPPGKINSTESETNDTDESFTNVLQSNSEVPVVINTIPEEVLPEDCGISYAIFKVFGGKTSEPGAWPWLAAIQYKEGEIDPYFACGGALIHKKYILTAAHCVTGKKGLRDVHAIRLGDHNLASNTDKTEPQEFKPAEIIPHEQYTAGGSHYNDIALIRLDREAEITEFVTPICLPSKKDPLTEDTLKDSSLTVAGWGSDGNKSSSDTLLQVDIKIVPTERCQFMYSRFGFELLPTQMCAGGHGKDSCRGDSGGPLMYPDSGGRYRVAGIVSLGSVRCGQGLPGIYTVVNSYTSWITKTIKERS